MEVDNVVYSLGTSLARPMIYAGLGWLVAVSLLGLWFAGHAVRSTITKYVDSVWVAPLCFGAVLTTGFVCTLAMALTVVLNDSQINVWYVTIAVGFAVLGLSFLRRLSRLIYPPL